MASNDISVSLKTTNLKDKDENLVLNFEGGSIISTGGNIKITQDGKTIEEIAIGGGKTSGGVYHSNSMVWDYEYNWIGLVNDDIFKHLANHNNKKISDKTEEEWTTELRNDWKIAINGDLYSLAKRDQTLSSDDYYNYHETDPQYTPGVDKSGNGDVVLTPSSGIEQLIIDPSNLENGGSYLIDLSDAGLISASDNSKDLLPAPLEINVGTSLTPAPIPTPTPTPTPTPSPAPTPTPSTNNITNNGTINNLKELESEIKEFQKNAKKIQDNTVIENKKNHSITEFNNSFTKILKYINESLDYDVDVLSLVARVLAKLNAAEIKALAASTLQDLSADQISVLSDKAVSAFSAKQVKNLPAAAAAGFTKSQVSEISPKAMRGFTGDHIKKLPTKTFKALDIDQLKRLSKDAVTGLTEQHLKTLTDDEIPAFKPTQIEVISPDAISGLKPSVLNALNKGQIKALTDDQLAGLTNKQIRKADAFFVKTSDKGRLILSDYVRGDKDVVEEPTNPSAPSYIDPYVWRDNDVVEPTKDVVEPTDRDPLAPIDPGF